eukprot:3773408-Rhodomonas_salina.1
MGCRQGPRTDWHHDFVPVSGPVLGAGSVALDPGSQVLVWHHDQKRSLSSTDSLSALADVSWWCSADGDHRPCSALLPTHASSRTFMN